MLSTVTTPVEALIVIPAGVVVSSALAIEKTNGVVPPVKVKAEDDLCAPWVVMMFDPLLTTMLWLTRIVITL